jgi:hypothetical protein
MPISSRRIPLRHGLSTRPTATTIPTFTHHSRFMIPVHIPQSCPLIHSHKNICINNLQQFLRYLSLPATDLLTEPKHSSHSSRMSSRRMQRDQLRVGTNGNSLWWCAHSDVASRSSAARCSSEVVLGFLSARCSCLVDGERHMICCCQHRG